MVCYYIKLKMNKSYIVSYVKENILLIAVLGLLVAVRLVFITFFAEPFNGDSLVFLDLSKNLNEYLKPVKTGIASFHIPPMQPLFLWFVRFLGGDNKLAYGIGITLLDGVTAFIIYHIAILVFSNKRIALLSAMAVALYPQYVWQASRLYSEPLFTCLLSLAVFFMIKSILANKARYMLLGGIMLGLATLTRPVAQFYPWVFICLIAYVFHKDIRRLIYKCAIFLFSFYIIISPTIARNYICFRKFVPGSGSQGFFML